MKSSVVLFSGGLDSTVCLGLAAKEFDNVIALSFSYGQKHSKELLSARKIVESYSNVEHVVVEFDAALWGGSSLTDGSLNIPLSVSKGIPPTYVPARNIIFLSFGLSVAEAKEAEAVYIGVNALDYSGYPDCRPEFIQAFRKVAELGQKRGVEGNAVRIMTPIIDMSKADIVRKAKEIGVPLELTWSCYSGGEKPCAACDSCRLRAKGFAEAGITDLALEGAVNESDG